MLKIVFSDIDGTIINSNHQVTPFTKSKIVELKEHHIPFILVSARMPKGIKPIYKQIGINDCLIAYSGGLVLDDNDQILYSNGIDIDSAKDIYNYINKHSEVSISSYCYDNWYSEVYDEWIKQEEDITSLQVIKSNFDNEDTVHKFLCMGEPEEIDKLEVLLKSEFPNLSIYKSKDTYLEIMNGSVSKSTALEVILKYYNIDTEFSISFGDNFNDIDMLKTTQVGYTMGNAPKGVKDKAPNVIDSNDEDGVGKIIAKYLNDKCI